MRGMRTARAGWLKVGIAALAALTVSVLGTGSAAADPDCANGTACYFSENSYLGIKANPITDNAQVATWFAGDFPIKSAKNEFGNRRVQFTSGGFVKCLDPGEVDPTLASYNAWRLGATGTRC